MEIRTYRNGDEQKIMDLDARELPSVWNRRTLDNWYWKFTDRNPAGHSFIWVAEHEGQLIGHFAAVPYKLKVFDEVITASHTIGALVDKKYQNRGLLKFVGEKLMCELVENNVPYTWGFPNRNAHRFENVVLKYNDLILFDIWKAERASLKEVKPDAAVREINQFGPEFDRLWEQCSSQYTIAVKRDSVYLNWRYLQRPDWKYYPLACYEGEELKGYAVLKLYREESVLRGHFVDIFAGKDDRRTLERLIDAGIHFLLSQQITEITVLFKGNPLIESLFIEKGLSQVQTQIPLILRVNKEHKYIEQVKDSANWYFCMGDSTEVY